jgi:hypothetical protein
MSWMMTDKDARDGTCYIEFLPGRYRGKCWNSESAYFDEEHFGFIEPVIERHYQGYNHYAINDIPKHVWEMILADLKRLRSKLAEANALSDIEKDIGFIFLTSKSDFCQQETENLSQLRQMLDDVLLWAHGVLKRHDAIAVLGI